MNEAVDEIPWGEIAEADWLGEAAARRYTPQQAKFAACRQAGLAQWRAARAAGYSGDAEQLRKAGSAADKTVGVVQLRKWAEEQLLLRGLKPPEEPLLSREDRRRLLNKHAQSKDATTSLRALEHLEKFDKADAEAADWESPDGLSCERIVRSLLMIRGGAVTVVQSLTGDGLGLCSLPILHDVVAALRATDPEYLDILRRREKKADLEELERKLSNPQWQRSERIKVWGEIGMTLEDVNDRFRRLASNHEPERLSA